MTTSAVGMNLRAIRLALAGTPKEVSRALVLTVIRAMELVNKAAKV